MGAIHFSLDPRLATFFKDHLGIATFVETGTFEGATIETARGLFPSVYSVEFSPHYFQKAVERFAAVPQVKLAQGDSTEFLKKNAAQFSSQPSLFWLDAHWCNAEHTAGGDSQSPLLGEITAIGSLHPKSTVLIDDARLYLCPPPRPHRYTDWPDWHDITLALLKLSATHRLMILNDVVILYPAELRERLGQFAFENGADWLYLTHMANIELKRQQRPRRKWRLFGKR